MSGSIAHVPWDSLLYSFQSRTEGVPLVVDLVAVVRVHPVMIGGEHPFGELAVVGLEDRGLVAEDVEREAEARGDPVGLVDRALALDRAPVLAEPDAER